MTMLAHEPGQVTAPAGVATFADAVQLANEGRETEALAAFQRIVTANPNDHEARLWIARLHERMDNMSLAEAVYRSVLLEDGDNVEAMLGVGAALLARDEPAEAIEMFERAERLAPQSDVIQEWLGRGHRQAGRTARAISYFERAYALAPTEQHRVSLQDARLVYFHRVETRGFSEHFNDDSTPDTRSGELAINYRVNDTLRVTGRGQVQRTFSVSDERGGGGVEWQWKPAVTLRGHALIGPDARVIPEGDYLGEIDYTIRQTSWTGSVRYLDFDGARVHLISPAVSWMASERLSMGVRYALSLTESNTLLPRTGGHSVHVRGAYRYYPRLWITAGYAGGVENFDTFSIDKIGDFRANTLSGGARFDLESLTSIVGAYEHQWRARGLHMGRVTVSLAQRF